MITDCQPDDQRLAPLKESMDTYGVEGDSPEWPANTLSIRTRIYSCGAIFRDGDDATVHNHASDEYALCQRLASEAAEIIGDTEVGSVDLSGSEASDPFTPFFQVANADADPRSELTEESLREAFGGTIDPSVGVEVALLATWLEEKTEAAWEDHNLGVGEETEEEISESLQPVQKLVAWFTSQPDLHSASYITVGNDHEGGTGAVFPRLVLALTPSGSLVGLFGQIVLT